MLKRVLVRVYLARDHSSPWEKRVLLPFKHRVWASKAKHHCAYSPYCDCSMLVACFAIFVCELSSRFGVLQIDKLNLFGFVGEQTLALFTPSSTKSVLLERLSMILIHTTLYIRRSLRSCNAVLLFSTYSRPFY